MAINMIYSDGDVFDALVYGESHPANINYFQNQVSNVSNMLTGIGQNFFSNMAILSDQFHGSKAMSLARAAMRATTNLFVPNRILSIFDIGGLQQAQPVMQRWVMANPMVRELYHAQCCEGYEGSYVDMSPAVKGEEHYDYRRVMNGVIQETDDDSWCAKFYMDDLHEGDRELIHDEKIDIMNTWDIIEMFIKAGKEDPTSVYNNSL